MPTTMEQARDEMCRIVHDHVQGIDSALRPIIVYDDDSQVPTEADTLSWMRVSVQHSGGRQETLGRPGGRRWGRFGIFSIQIFTLAGNDSVAADTLADNLLAVLEAYHSANLWLRNPRPVDAGRSGSWNQVNVIADFEYTVIR